MKKSHKVMAQLHSSSREVTQTIRPSPRDSHTGSYEPSAETYTNSRIPIDDSDSVAEILDQDSIPDVVSYWRTKALEPQWKDLARMALDYLTILAMSAEPERVFSAAKITLTDWRCRMGDDAIEALECLKSWQRDGLIAATKQDIKVIEDMLNALCEEDLA